MHHRKTGFPVAVAASLLAVAGASVGVAAPNAHNLEAFAQRLVTEKARLLVVADSIWSDDVAGRMPVGVRDTWNVDFFGWTVKTGFTAIDCLGMAMQAASAPDDFPSPPGAGFGRTCVHHSPPSTGSYNVFQPGNLTVSPKPFMESRFHGDWTRGAPFWRGVLQAGHPNSSGINQFANFRRGSWLSSSMNITAIFYHDSSTLSRFELIPYRNGFQTFGGQLVQPAANGVQGYTINCFGFGEPWIQFQAEASLAEQAYNAVTGPANSNLVVLGAHFEDAMATDGVSFTVIANPGWSGADHLSPAMCTDANLAGYLAGVRNPNLVLIQLGANVEANEVDGSGNLLPLWKANVESLIARYRTLLTFEDGGGGPPPPPPLFLLVAQYDLGPSYVRTPAIAEALHEISQAQPDVAFINLYAFAGSHAGLLSNNYLSDGVHPTTAGSDYLANLLWIALSNAVCGGDTNGDRTVDFLDLNALLTDFGITAPGRVTDVNNDGAVDFIDLNLILTNFGQSC